MRTIFDTRKRSWPEAGRPCRRMCARSLIRRTHRAIQPPTRFLTASAFFLDHEGHEDGTYRLKSAFSARPAWSASSSSRLLANHPWFRSRGSARAIDPKARPIGTRPRGGCRRRFPTTSRGLSVDAATPGRAPKLVFSGLDSSVAGEIEGAFAEAGHFIISNSKNYRMEADVPLLIPGDQRRSSGAPRRAGGRARLEGPHRHQPELLDRRAVDGAGAAPAVRPEERHDHDAAGDLRRRVSRRRVVGHSRQRDPVHRRRRAQDRDGDEEDSRLLRRQARRAAPGDGQRDDDAGRGPGRTHRIDFGRPGSTVRRPRRSSTRSTSFKGKPQELGLPSAPAQPVVYLTRAEPAAADARRQSRSTA